MKKITREMMKEIEWALHYYKKELKDIFKEYQDSIQRNGLQVKHLFWGLFIFLHSISTVIALTISVLCEIAGPLLFKPLLFKPIQFFWNLPLGKRKVK